VYELKPELKVLVLISSDSAISLSDLAGLADRGLVPADRDPGLAVGLKKGVFSTRLKFWLNRPPLPPHLSGAILERFTMTGIYRTTFKVVKRGYEGPLTLEVTAPRDGFGRKLMSCESTVRPVTETESYVDAGGNRWLKAHYEKIEAGQPVRFHFAFRYLVDMRELLYRDVLLVADQDTEQEIPADVKVFLEPGYKINPRLPEARAWALRGGRDNPNVRDEVLRMTKFLKTWVTYDQRKREQYFGGRSVYSDLDDMYQDLSITLARGLGACPDTYLLECAFYRARGIPCRIAARFGHFFTMVYAPGRGWVSTSVTPTGIPLLIAPGPDHVPFQKWEPHVPVRTAQWEARVRIEPLLEE
jgi:hypothetical protein